MLADDIASGGKRTGALALFGMIKINKNVIDVVAAPGNAPLIVGAVQLLVVFDGIVCVILVAAKRRLLAGGG